MSVQMVLDKVFLTGENLPTFVFPTAVQFLSRSGMKCQVAAHGALIGENFTTKWTTTFFLGGVRTNMFFELFFRRIYFAARVATELSVCCVRSNHVDTFLVASHVPRRSESARTDGTFRAKSEFVVGIGSVFLEERQGRKFFRTIRLQAGIWVFDTVGNDVVMEEKFCKGLGTYGTFVKLH